MGKHEGVCPNAPHSHKGNLGFQKLFGNIRRDTNIGARHGIVHPYLIRPGQTFVDFDESGAWLNQPEGRIDYPAAWLQHNAAASLGRSTTDKVELEPFLTQAIWRPA